MEEMRNFEYEETVDLKQLLIYIFRKWRTMLAAAVVLGLVLGGLKTAGGFMDLQDPEKVEDSIKSYELTRQNYDTAKAQLTNQMAEYNRQIDNYQRYQENSLYMKIDPYAVYTESITYVVTTDYQILPNMTYQTLNWMGPVLSAYTSVATSVTLRDLSPEGQAGLSEEWDADSLDKLIKVETKPDDGKLTITASAESEVRAKAILQAIKEKVESSQESIAKAAGEHKLSVISEKSSVTVDQTMINDREGRLRNITALREAADKAVEKFDKLRKPKDSSLSEGSVIKSGIKFAILGAVAGVFFCCFLFCIQFLMNGKLNDPGSLKERYQTRILADLPNGKTSGIIDRILDSIEGKRAALQDGEKQLCVAAESLGGLYNGRSIAVAGTAPAELKAKAAETLQRAEEFAVVDAGDILTDPESVRKVRSADAVILMESKNISAMADIDRETELLKSMGIRLEGFILS